MIDISAELLQQIDPHICPVDVRYDLNAVVYIIETCFGGSMDDDGREYVRQLRRSAEVAGSISYLLDMAEGSLQPMQGLLWVDDGKATGNLTMIPLRKQNEPVVLIANVAVLPEFRQRGIGELLTLAAIKTIRESSVNSIWLQVRDDNPAAEGLYRKLGFVERARRTIWHHYRQDIKPAVPRDMSITPVFPSEWDEQLALLKVIYPDQVSWNLQMNVEKFKPNLFAQFSRMITGTQVRSWAVRDNARIIGTATWDATRTMADNIWLGAEEINAGMVLRRLLPYLLEVNPRAKPQAVNLPAGLAETAMLQSGFRKHYTLIWMELANPDR